MRNTVAEKSYNLKIFMRLGLGAFLCLAICGGLIVTAVYADRQAARFPDAELVSSHSNYSGLPSQFRWDDTYVSTADFRSVYRWYSGKFGLGAEAAANGSCIYSEAYQQQWLANRYVGILICENPEETMVFINRTTSFR